MCSSSLVSLSGALAVRRRCRFADRPDRGAGCAAIHRASSTPTSTSTSTAPTSTSSSSSSGACVRRRWRGHEHLRNVSALQRECPSERARVSASLGAVIDLRLLREDPDLVRASQRARGEDPSPRRRGARRRRAAALVAAPSSRRCGPSRRRFGKQVAQARGDEKQALRGAGQAAGRAGQGARRRRRDAAQAALDALHRGRSPTSSPTACPSGGEDDYVVLREVGERRDLAAEGFDACATTSSSASGCGADRHGARRQGLRRAVLLPHRHRGAARARAAQLGDRHRRWRPGFTPMITPTLVKPEVMAGTGFLGAHADEVYRLEADDLYLVGTSEVALAGYHADEILDLSRRPAAVRGLVGLLPPRGRLVRQGHPRHHPRAPVPQGRDVQLLHASRTPPRSTSACSRGRRRCSPASSCRTA